MTVRRIYRKRKKRIGRGVGSGHGKTSCRGMKGQFSRSGASRTPGFEGGQMPLIRRVPKRGFTNAAFRQKMAIVNIKTIAALDVSDITPALLVERRIVNKKNDGIKILGTGRLTRALTVHAAAFSKKAKAEIEKAGGKAMLLT